MALPLYEAQQVRELDRRTIETRGVSGGELMALAATATWQQARRRWPAVRSVAILCGTGNNGGDGYEIAQLARAAGCEVRCIALGDPRPDSEAAAARARWDGALAGYSEGCLDDAEMVIDALFGTGLSRAPDGQAADAIRAINARPAEVAVVAVDVPSGLDADTGHAHDPAVRARLTVSFIGRKLGLYVGDGPDIAGERVFAPLGPFDDGSLPCAADLLEAEDLRALLPTRSRTAHKGSNGHVLLVGGDEGTPGAMLMAGRAALRSGAGLVSLATRGAHAGLLNAAQPELMARTVDGVDALPAALERASVVAVGPGLGQQHWGRALWQALQPVPLPQVVDADALNLLAAAPRVDKRWILTPHPGEAGRLLGVSTAEVQQDRIAAVRGLRRRYGGIAVLKGAGTLVLGERLAVCPYGNPGMATGGMGDALTGIIAAFVAQGLELEAAARAGVLAHALAGDLAAIDGQRGLLPGDLIERLRSVVNP